jgi:hypothetical protein
MSTRAAQFEILSAGVQYNADLVTTPYVTFFAAGTNDAKNAWDDKDKASAITKKALDTQGRATVFGDGIYKLKFYTGDPDAVAPLTGVLIFELDDYKCQATTFGVRHLVGTSTITPDDDTIICNGTFTLNLQTIEDFEHPLEILNVGSGTITIDPYSTETIEGSATLSLGAGEKLRLTPDVSANTWRWVDFISDVAAHAASTGTAVHGLGTMSTQNADAVAITGGTATLTSATLTSAEIPTLTRGAIAQGKDVTAAINRKIVNIGDWNMVSTNSVNVAHGLTFTKIRNVSVLIIDDAASQISPLNTIQPAGTVSGFWYANSTNVVIYKWANAAFDNTNYDSTSYNRGWVLIDYVD